jgi:hypothetical protein
MHNFFAMFVLLSHVEFMTKDIGDILVYISN